MYNRHNKYNVSPKEDRTANGITFASKMEMMRYFQLLLYEKGGLIKNIKRQPKFELIPKTAYSRAEYYFGDFQYEEKDGTIVVEDVKGFATRVFKRKFKIATKRYSDITFKIVDQV